MQLCKLLELYWRLTANNNEKELLVTLTFVPRLVPQLLHWLLSFSLCACDPKIQRWIKIKIIVISFIQ